ncbi:unnamed protein product [Hanseniaspora opuntiae]
MTLHLKITNTSTDPTNTYTLYHLSVYQVVSNNDHLLNKNVIKKRYSDFINLKEQLEARFKCKIPYEFPERKENFHSVNGKSNSLLSIGYIRNILPQDSLNKDVVRYRRKQLELFLNDLLSDPYDDKWRKCIVTRIFFNHCYDHLSEGVDVSHMFDDETKLSDIYMDQKGASSNNKDWWYLYRRIDDILINMDESDEAREKNLKEIINVRLLLQKLESGIMDTDSVLDRKKRQKEFKGLKKIYCLKKSIQIPNKKYDVVKPTPGRRLGSKRQVLQSQKDDLKSQEESLESLRETVVKQKMLSLAINEELLSQNELLTSLETDVDKSGAKIQKAHDKTEKYNNL